MDPSIKPEKRTYVVLMIMNVTQEWFDHSSEERKSLTGPHVKELRPYLEKVSLTSLQGTGLSKHSMIEVLESESLQAIEGMIEQFKTTAKARYADIKDIWIMEKGIERLR